MANFPYPIWGTITSTDSSTPSTRLTLRNDSNGESVNTTSNTSGAYLVDAANFTSGYLSSDRVTVIVGYGAEEGEESILLSSDTHNIDITLSEIAESTDTTYCEIQDVLDELGDKTTDDISYERIRKIILRNEAEIDERSGTKFTSTTVSDEYHDYNQYTSWTSPEGMMYPQSSGFGSYGRGDQMSTMSNDTIRLEKSPILSVTELSKSQTADYQSDNWLALTEQTGSGGDFILDKDTGVIKFVNDSPNYGKRQLKVSYTYGYSEVPRIIERLCILLSIRDVVTSKRTEAQFDGSQSINLGGEINISKFDSPSYMTWLNDEIERLWMIVGDLDMGRA